MSSEEITPEQYAKMKAEGTPVFTFGGTETKADSVDMITETQEQNLIGMDGAEGLGDQVDQYNYDTAIGVCQALDITPEEAEKMIDAGEDDAIIRTAMRKGTSECP